MRPARLAILWLVLAAAVFGCATSPDERQMIADVWAGRDAERTAECLRNGGQYTAGGGCVFRGP